ncbi:aldo/keto reductase [Marinomonas dokdonensis]|uniref:aldo/keto reductase n=1 Tax=Marinomonas dokdonensis TaxID=328224 RepID=UPI0040558447
MPQDNLSQRPFIGLGCMNVSHAYGEPLADTQAIALIQRAVDMGYQHFDTATLYGAGNNEKIVGKALKSSRDSVFLASKCGMENINGKRQINGRPENLRRQCEDSLKRLQTDHIDLYYLHRMDRDVPIEESVGALGDLVKEGKIGAVGLSEVSATTLTKAHREFTISALQSEYSLWTRNPEIAALDACQQLGVMFVAFSPIGRGFLSNQLKDINQLDRSDMRHSMPRFSPENFEQNLPLLNTLQSMSAELACTPAQLALAWLSSKGEHIRAIPGSRSLQHMEENLAATSISLSSQQLDLLDNDINQNNVYGARYNQEQQQDIDTEEFN